jgi:hypothetical protein
MTKDPLPGTNIQTPVQTRVWISVWLWILLHVQIQIQIQGRRAPLPKKQGVSQKKKCPFQSATREWKTWATVQHAGWRSRTSRRCIHARVAKGRYIRMSFARASAQRLTDTKRTTGAHRNVWSRTGHTVARNPRCHTVVRKTSCHREVPRAPSLERVASWLQAAGTRTSPTVFTFDFPLSDNFHLRLFWSNEFCSSVCDYIDYTRLGDTQRDLQYGHTYLHRRHAHTK